jgi:hypothetical protein
MIRSALTHHPTKLSSELLQRYGESRLTPSVSDLPRHGVRSLLFFARFCFRLLWSIGFSPRARQCGTSSRQHYSLRSALKRGRIRKSVLEELGRQSASGLISCYGGLTMRSRSFAGVLCRALKVRNKFRIRRSLAEHEVKWRIELGGSMDSSFFFRVKSRVADV